MMLSERQSSRGIQLSPLNLLAGPIINQKWTKRWFVIEDGFLTYYKKKQVCLYHSQIREHLLNILIVQDTEFAGVPIDLLFCSIKVVP